MTMGGMHAVVDRANFPELPDTSKDTLLLRREALLRTPEASVVGGNAREARSIP